VLEFVKLTDDAARHGIAWQGLDGVRRWRGDQQRRRPLKNR